MLLVGEDRALGLGAFLFCQQLGTELAEGLPEEEALQVGDDPEAADRPQIGEDLHGRRVHDEADIQPGNQEAERRQGPGQGPDAQQPGVAQGIAHRVHIARLQREDVEKAEQKQQHQEVEGHLIDPSVCPAEALRHEPVGGQKADHQQADQPQAGRLPEFRPEGPPEVAEDQAVVLLLVLDQLLHAGEQRRQRGADRKDRQAEQDKHHVADHDVGQLAQRGHHRSVRVKESHGFSLRKSYKLR